LYNDALLEQGKIRTRDIRLATEGMIS
jgi:hypothetical protein